MEMIQLDAFDPEVNPFEQDAYHMGTRVAKNLLIFHATHDTEQAKYIILLNTDTGERVKVLL